MFPVGGDPFFEELQEGYDQIGEAPPEGAPRPAPSELPEMTDEIRATGQFQMVSVANFDGTVSRLHGRNLYRPAANVLRTHRHGAGRPRPIV